MKTASKFPATYVLLAGCALAAVCLGCSMAQAGPPNPVAGTILQAVPEIPFHLSAQRPVA